MATFKNIDIEEPSSVTASVSAVEITRNSSAELQEIVSLGDPDTTNAVAAILNSAPASTAWGLVVRPRPTTVTQGSTVWVTQCSSLGGVVAVDQNSTTWVTQCSSLGGVVAVDQNSTDWVTQCSSLAGQVTVVPITSSGLELTTNTAPASTAEAVITRQVGYSTTVNVSTVSGRVLVDQNSTTWVTQCSSVAGVVAVDQNSTVWVAQVSSLGGTVGINVESFNGVPVNNVLSTVGLGFNQQAIVVREVPEGRSTTVSGQLSSAESTILAANSTSKWAVYSIDITGGPGSSVTVRMLRGSTVEAARWFFHSTVASYGLTKNVTPPGYLFKTTSNQSIVLVGDTTVRYTISAYEGQ